MVSEANAVCDWLRSTWKISVPDDWLQACIEWIHSENQGARTALGDLCNLVFEQWLACDLREIGAQCLPSALSQHQKHLLNGAYGLQMNSIVDVGISFYGQLQKVQGAENSNVTVSATQPSWEPKPSRMLMMTLTDGMQEIKAMEYHPIPALNGALAPGTKLLVMGNVLCRCGVLMLRSENIRILGGEVDSLMEENSADKVLSSFLQTNVDAESSRRDLPKMTFDITGQKSARKASAVASVGGNSKPVSATVVPRTNNRISLGETFDVPDDDLISMAVDVDELETRQYDDDYLDYLNSIESNMNCEMQSDMREISSTAAKRLSCDECPEDVEENNSKRPRTVVMNDSFNNSLFNDDDDDFDWETSLNSAFRMRQNLPGKAQEGSSSKSKMLSSKLCEKTVMSQVKTKREAFDDRNAAIGKVLPSTDVRDKLPLKDDSVLIRNSYRGCNPVTVCNFQDDDFDSIAKAEKLPTNQLNNVLPSELSPFTYLSRILDQRPFPKSKVFRVKAFISTLVGRLEHNQGSHWSLIVKINDGSAAVDVLLANEILEKLIGFSAVDCMKMRQVARTDRDVKQKIAQGIQRCQETLIKLSTIMEIELSSVDSIPLVSRFHPVTRQDIEALNQRVKAF